MSTPKSITPLAVREPQPARPLWLPEAGLAIGLLLALAVVWLARMRRRPTASAPEAPADDFDALLDTAREQTLDNPRVTADVIKLWMRA